MTTIARAYVGVRTLVLQRWAMLALIVINVIAGVVGTVYWYGDVILSTPWWAMVFVPDCPLFSLLFAIALVGIWRGKEWTWFNAIVAFGCIKYGIWTITVWVLYWSAGYPATSESIIMTILHVGLLLQGVFLLGFLTRLRWRHVILAGAWFALSDFVDYGLGYHPRMAPGVPVEGMMWEMIVMTALLTGLLGFMVVRRQRLDVGRKAPALT